MNVHHATYWARHAATGNASSEASEMWNVIDQLSAAELGGASNPARHRSLVEAAAAETAFRRDPGSRQVIRSERMVAIEELHSPAQPYPPT